MFPHASKEFVAAVLAELQRGPGTIRELRARLGADRSTGFDALGEDLYTALASLRSNGAVIRDAAGVWRVAEIRGGGR